MALVTNKREYGLTSCEYLIMYMLTHAKNVVSKKLLSLFISYEINPNKRRDKDPKINDKCLAICGS